MRLNVKTNVASGPIHEAAATQTFNQVDELRRLVGCCLLGERQFYVDGADITDRIRTLSADVLPSVVAEIAVEARRDLGLRHVPLLLLIALAPRKAGVTVREAARVILRTPKDAMDLVALYWSAGKRPLPHAFKAAIRDGFARWTDYQIAKYATLTNVAVRLRDLAFMAHPTPLLGRDAIFCGLADDKLRAPDTWEAALSVPGADKCAVWERLLSEGKLGALALVRNLRNMEAVGVQPSLVRASLADTKASDVWPWQALAAAREAPAYTHDLDALMIRSAGALPQIRGRTGVLVDISGSMDQPLSAKGSMLRLDAAAGLAVVLREVCEDGVLAAFSHEMKFICGPLARGATLANVITGCMPHGGTRLGQAILDMTSAHPDLDRLVVLTDEQSHDRVAVDRLPEAYIVNLASYQRGVSWHGPVTRINGWSGGVVRYIAQRTTGVLPPSNDDDGEETE